MAKLVRRARGWVNDRLRTLADWPCRAELSKLRAQKRELVAALDAVEDLVVLSCSDGRLRFANRAAASLIEEVTGRDATQALGRLPTELGLPAALVRQITEQNAQMNATLAAATAEIAIPRRGGEHWYEQKVSPVLDDGRLSSAVMIGRDIDARKRAQRRLELLAKVSTLVGDLDLDELLPAIARLSVPELADWSVVDVRAEEGRTRRVCIAQRDPGKAALVARLQQLTPWVTRAGWEDLEAGRSLFVPEVTDERLRAAIDDPEHLAVLQKVGILSTIAVPLRLHDATVAVMSFATTAESGRRYGPDDLALAQELARRAAGVIDRARLHAELKASDARFRIALSMARTFVYEQDRELRYRWHYNSPWGGGDLVGKTHEDFLPPELAEVANTFKRRVLETGEPVRGERRGPVEGEQRVFMAAIEPLRDERGAVVGILGASTDITEEKRVQEELEQAVTFREQLIGIVGHDLRNPLSAILAATGLLRRRADVARPVLEHVERIDRAARRMAEMIGTVLDFTQTRFHGSLPLTPAPTDLAEVARAILDELRAAAPERRVELEVRGDARGQWDAARLGQVLSNLVGNALVHGAAGEPVRVAIDAVGAGDVWLRVHNAGEPIPPEARETLFEPFRRGDGRGASRAPGLGLGLYIVRQIVLAHEGAVGVDSTPSGGTTFTVRLPRRLRRQPAGERGMAHEARSAR